jgi:preprotein translocase subunit SecA
LSDLIYKDQFSNGTQLLNHVTSSTGQPILIGTTTVEKSEMLAQLLGEYKLSYQLLNAKPENVREEKSLLKQVKGSITIATNMAGRN